MHLKELIRCNHNDIVMQTCSSTVTTGQLDLDDSGIEIERRVILGCIATRRAWHLKTCCCGWLTSVYWTQLHRVSTSVHVGTPESVIAPRACSLLWAICLQKLVSSGCPTSDSLTQPQQFTNEHATWQSTGSQSVPTPIVFSKENSPIKISTYSELEPASLASSSRAIDKYWVSEIDTELVSSSSRLSSTSPVGIQQTVFQCWNRSAMQRSSCPHR